MCVTGAFVFFLFMTYYELITLDDNKKPSLSFYEVQFIMMELIQLLIMTMILVLLKISLENITFENIANILTNNTLIHLFVIYNLSKICVSSIKKLGKYVFKIPDHFLICLDVISLFIVNGLFILLTNDHTFTSNTTKLLISINVIVIIVGLYNTLANPKNPLDVVLLSSNLIYLFIIISLIISK
tara:strand:+ start:1714 stop:2268 length:555 start_codon:yes stop_codon:yes gene_type:complete